VRGLRVLAVDDNRANRALIEALLLPFGVDLTSASDGEEAVNLARFQRYDVILMDIHMPDIDGVQAARLIREDAGSLNRQTPIVAFTAEMPGIGPNYDSTCFDAALEKPLRLPSILKILAGYVTRKD
jgi:two-component system sensor histidine kinase BarA